MQTTVTVKGETIGNARPWVALIQGRDPKYGFAREFLTGVRDYSRANSVGSRGIVTVWTLGDGLYEISLPQSWSRTERFFARVVDGQLERISAAEVAAEFVQEQEA